uniref:Uncharacterized protein n=1 Tax=Anguilla anguilla TaxID=7936 RepID=A0A0E9V4X5_ANGAN
MKRNKQASECVTKPIKLLICGVGHIPQLS